MLRLNGGEDWEVVGGAAHIVHHIIWQDGLIVFATAVSWMMSNAVLISV